MCDINLRCICKRRKITSGFVDQGRDFETKGEGFCWFSEGGKQDVCFLPHCSQQRACCCAVSRPSCHLHKNFTLLGNYCQWSAGFAPSDFLNLMGSFLLCKKTCIVMVIEYTTIYNLHISSVTTLKQLGGDALTQSPRCSQTNLEQPKRDLSFVCMANF